MVSWTWKQNVEIISRATIKFFQCDRWIDEYVSHRVECTGLNALVLHANFLNTFYKSTECFGNTDISSRLSEQQIYNLSSSCRNQRDLQ